MDTTAYTAIGGKVWTSSDGTKTRVYFPDQVVMDLIDLTITTYKTGNISSARLRGAKIANGKADKLRDTIRFGKFYLDCANGQLHTEGLLSLGTDLVTRLEQNFSARTACHA